MKNFKILYVILFCLVTQMSFAQWYQIGNKMYTINDQVGIKTEGIPSSNYALQVDGNAYVNGGWLRVSGNRGVYFEDYGGGLMMQDNDWVRIYNNKNFYTSGIIRTDGMLKVGGGNIVFFKADFDDKTVQIGDHFVPEGYSLSVDGKVICEGLRVSSSTNWPDYVFEKDYDLMPLDEVERSIEKNGHLPGIPSAEVVEEEGIDVGEMQRLMMEKIEELTLYVIDLKKENDELKEEVKKLQE